MFYNQKRENVLTSILFASKSGESVCRNNSFVSEKKLDKKLRQTKCSGCSQGQNITYNSSLVALPVIV